MLASLPRVGVILHDFSLGGTERIASRLANAWADAGAAVTLFCGRETGPLREIVSDTVRVVPAHTPLERGFGMRTVLGQHAARHFTNDPVDVVWIPGNYHWPVIPALRRAGNGRGPAIVAQVSAALVKPQRGPFRQSVYDWRMRRLLGAADRVVTLADAASEEASRILHHDRVTHIPLPALDRSTPMPQPIPAGPPVIMAAGRLVPEKGFANLIAAFAGLNHPEARLLIAGSGPEEERLRALAETLGVTPRLTMTGYVPDIRPLLDTASMFVLSSDFEGYAAVLIEALAAGRRVVTTDCTPATTDLLSDPRHGRVVPIGDVAALSAAIGATLASPAPDPFELAAMVGRFRIDPVARHYLSVFDEVRQIGAPAPYPSVFAPQFAPALARIPQRTVGRMPQAFEVS